MLQTSTDPAPRCHITSGDDARLMSVQRVAHRRDAYRSG
jgi:hypothetical protein